PFTFRLFTLSLFHPFTFLPVQPFTFYPLTFSPFHFSSFHLLKALAIFPPFHLFIFSPSPPLDNILHCHPKQINPNNLLGLNKILLLFM
ncbi:MAG: hypothetical protein ACFNM7_09620, partial [Prevotella conceptionensis]